MSWKCGWVIGLLVCSPLLQAAGPRGNPTKKGDAPEAMPYAELVLGYASEISREYVREVRVNDILTAAIEGLYDAARQPAPGDILERLKVAESERELRELLVEARGRLGNHAALVESRDLIASLRAFSSVLDPHCVLASARSFQANYEGHFGFGFDLEGEEPGNSPLIPFRVVKVYSGGPAQRAGIKPGDLLTRVDNQAVTADSSTAIYRSIFLEPADPEKPQKHEFTVLRVGKKEPLRIEVSKDTYVLESIFGVRRRDDNSWDFWLDPERKIAYLRIGAIDYETAVQMQEALEQLNDARGLILDLRWCPGGFLTQAAELAGMFLREGKIASVKYRNPQTRGQTEYRADNNGLRRFRYVDVPLVALVNGETLGGGELIAAALQDRGRAKVAGQRTFGKASIQTRMDLEGFDNIVLKLSAGTFERPNGKNLQRFSKSTVNEDWGVRPDKGFEIPSSASLSVRLKEWHQDYLLRPPDCRETLPLDDPENDAQRISAMRMLLRSLKSK